MSNTKFTETEKFAAELKRCIDCGYCGFWCPVYAADPSETSLARGKNVMIRKMLAGQAEYSDEFATLLSKCTLCKACATHCPFQSQVQSTIVAARADKVKEHGIAFPASFIYQSVIPHRTLFGNVLKFTSWFQGLFLPKTDATLRHMPMFMSGLGKGRQIPSIAPKFFRQQIPVVNSPPGGVKTKMKVGYFIGCATDYVFPQVGLKTVDFLTRNGVEVVVPRAQGCCGAPVWEGAGDFATGRKLADNNVRAFAAFPDLDYIITDCATCAASLKQYGKFLADTPDQVNRFNKFGDKVIDVAALLVDKLKLPKSAFQPIDELKGKTITWHDPCHSVRYLDVKEQPRQILKALPGVKYQEMVRADWCCGMAGAFSIYYYDISKKIGDRKAETVKDTGADVVVTGCPGCIMQLNDTFKRNGMSPKVMHIMEVLK